MLGQVAILKKKEKEKEKIRGRCQEAAFLLQRIKQSCKN